MNISEKVTNKSILFSISITLPCTLLQGNSESSNKSPNVLLIVADDLGYKDLSCYGSDFYETPYLDKLANEGIKFTNGYASCPVCSPTRASIQTGKYPTKVNITDWIPGRAMYSKPSPRDRFLSASLDNQLALEEITIAEVLKDNGYKTFFAGKWHLGQTWEYWPENQGYDINIGGHNRGMPNRNKEKGYKGFFSPYGNPRLNDGPDGEYLPDRLADETIKFIEDNKDQNFYVCLSFYLVHTPMQAKEKTINKYKEKAKQLGIDTIEPFVKELEWMKHGSKNEWGYKERIIQSLPVYAAMVESLDENIGRVLQKLEELNIDKNTVVIFTSDNGGLSTAEGSPTCNLPLKGGKGWLNEGGIREPYIFRYPGIQNEGFENSMPISSIDIFPTILSQAGIDINDYKDIDGIDLTPYFEAGEYPERNLFWHYPHYSNQGGNPGSVIISGDYKLIHDFETGKKELYNLKNDIGETNDLSSSDTSRVNKMYNLLENWRKETGAKMMEPNPEWNGVEPIVEQDII